jgi:iduronate 2-sulfatase
MVPLLDDPDRDWKSAAFTQFPRPAYYKNKYDVMGYAVRTERFHYIEWIDVKKKQPMGTELYDHKIDPYELTNLAQKEQYQPIVDELSQLLKKGWKAALPNRR